MLNDENKLMYELIFGTEKEYEINFSKYVQNITELPTFIDKVLMNLKKSGVKIKEDILILTKNKNLWILKIEK
jgi:tetrahydromethanopterin S-methyltransferase subunit H